MAPPHTRPEPDFVLVPPDPATASVERLRRQALRLLTEPSGESGDEAAAGDGLDDPRGERAPLAAAAPSMITGLVAMPVAFLAVVLIALSLFGAPDDSARPRAAATEPLTQPALAPAAGRAASPALISASASAPGVIQLADDARVQAIALDGDRIALHVESPAGREIVVFDYREGRQIAAAAIETFSAEAADSLSMLTGPPPPEAAAPAPAPEAAFPTTAPRAVFTSEPRLKPRGTL